MRFLCINPNTDPAMTATVAAALRTFLPPAAELIETTGRFGAPYIAARATYAIGGHAALDALLRHAGEPLDAILLACFGDPGLEALREIAAVPVIGMAEASCRAASREAGGFSIVCGGHGWRAMLTEFLSTIRLADRLVSIQTITLTGGEIMRAPEAATDALLAAVDRCKADGAARVILGGAGLAGLAARLRPLSSLPIVDCVEALAEAAVAAVLSERKAGLAARPSPEVAALGNAGWLGAGN